MEHKNLYFSDNFFSTGKKDIFTKDKEIVGELNMKSAFTSTIDILDIKGNHLINGKFPLFSNRWTITNQKQEELGFLRSRFSFFAKKYEYTAQDRGIYKIETEVMFNKYEIVDQTGSRIGQFSIIKNFFMAPAYELIQFKEDLEINEMIAIITGINAIQKRSHSASKTTV